MNFAPRAAPQSKSLSGAGARSLSLSPEVSANEGPRRGVGASRAGKGPARRHWLASSAAEGAKSRRAFDAGYISEIRH